MMLRHMGGRQSHAFCSRAIYPGVLGGSGCGLLDDVDRVRCVCISVSVLVPPSLPPYPLLLVLMFAAAAPAAAAAAAATAVMGGGDDDADSERLVTSIAVGAPWHAFCIVPPCHPLIHTYVS